MSNTTHEVQWKAYSEAWADIRPEERTKFLTQSVSTNCSFTDPDTEKFGLEELTSHIEKFQQQFSGAYFETRGFIEHHGQSVAEWMMHSQDGSDFLPGKSVARYGDDGKMTQIAGFWRV